MQQLQKLMVSSNKLHLATNQKSEFVIKMNHQIKWELKTFGRDEKCCGYWRHKKAGMIALLWEQSLYKMPLHHQY